MFIKHRLLTVFVSATGVSLVVQALAFLRQLLIAAYFGIGRDFDGYVVVYAAATYAVFTFGAIFDSIAVPHLVRAREREGPEAARALAASIFRISIGLGVIASVLFLVAVPLLAPIIATGFSTVEKQELSGLAWYFLPWTLICLPYYAATARHKMEWQFNRVFAAEIIIIVVSIATLTLWHDDIGHLPLAYAAGYAVGLVQLVLGSDLVWPKGMLSQPSSRGVLRNIAELFGANQSGNFASVVDRHIQSFVPAGGVSAINYSAQLVTALGILLAFREVFVVPLAQELDRTAKLERLLCGLVLISIPLTGVVACLAPEIVTILFQRGRFDATATALTAQAVRINVLGLITGAVFMPLMRMFQILDRIHLMHILFLTLALSSALSGYLFVVALGLGVRGVAIMQVTSSAAMCLTAIWLLARCGIRPAWSRVAGYIVFASLASGAAFVVAAAAISGQENVLVRLIGGGLSYAMIIVVFYFMARPQLRGIAFGPESHPE
ncbi:MAG: lipid II flippase MurJ [Pseudolabrys sp.]